MDSSQYFLQLPNFFTNFSNLWESLGNYLTEFVNNIKAFSDYVDASTYVLSLFSGILPGLIQTSLVITVGISVLKIIFGR